MKAQSGAGWGSFHVMFRYAQHDILGGVSYGGYFRGTTLEHVP
jgi:hypothetical protein